MEEKEVWKSLDFLGYPNYEVSSFGRVKSLNYKRSGKEKILKPSKNKYNYLKVDLSKDGKRKYYQVHRLVCLVFLENPENLPCINHKDENKENNHVDNLEFCTYQYNNSYGTKPERLSKALKGRNLTEETKKKLSEVRKGRPNYKQRKPILQYTKEGEFIREWDSATTVIKELNIKYSQNIYSCCKGKQQSVGGFIWRYKM